MRIKISGLNLHYCLREHRILYLLWPNTSHHVVLLMAACAELWASTASFSQTFNVLRRFFQTVMKAAPLPIMLRLQTCGHQHDVLLHCGLLGRQWWHLNAALCGSAMPGGWMRCRGCWGVCEDGAVAAGGKQQLGVGVRAEIPPVICLHLCCHGGRVLVTKNRRVWWGLGSSGKFVNVV